MLCFLSSSLHFLRFVLCFFFLIRRSPSSTLFPYTTLFRSKLWSSIWLPPHLRRAWEERFPGTASIRGLRQRFAEWQKEDRKSTRLNSSHLVTSYAVFCLKKKTNTSHIASADTQ